MAVDLGPERRRHREERFTVLVRAFARDDYAALEGGVRPDVELTLRRSSWLAGKYRGYAEFGQRGQDARIFLTNFLTGAANHIARPDAAIPGTTSHRVTWSPQEGRSS
jgi:hypothetical protein